MISPFGVGNYWFRLEILVMFLGFKFLGPFYLMYRQLEGLGQQSLNIMILQLDRTTIAFPLLSKPFEFQAPAAVGFWFTKS